MAETNLEKPKEVIKTQKERDYSIPMGQFSKAFKPKAQVLNYAEFREMMLQNAKKSVNKTYAKYDKASIQQYMLKPASYIDKIRDVSQFVYRVSLPYAHIINHYAGLPQWNYNITYKADLQKGVDQNKLMKDYYNALVRLQAIDMKVEGFKSMLYVLRDGAEYAIIHDDTKGNFFSQQLDPQYCKITAQTETGQYVFSFNMKYFEQGNNKEFVEGVDGDTSGVWEEFVQPWKEYQADKVNAQWWTVPPEISRCMIPPGSDPTVPLPPFAGIMTDTLDLIDLQSILQNKTELENYILLVGKLPLNENTGEIDDFAVSYDMAKNFTAMVEETLPAGAGIVFSPLEIDTVNFTKSNTSADTDKLAQAYSNLYRNAGISEALGNMPTTNTTGISYSIKEDSNFINAYVNEFENWVNSYMKANISENFIFKFHRTTSFDQNEYVNSKKEEATLGGSALDYFTSTGETPYEAYSKIMMEEALGIKDILKPLSTSYTQTDNSAISDEGGRPKEDDSKITESGAKSRDQREEA